MSSPAEQGPSEPTDKKSRNRLSRALSRMSTALKRGESSKTQAEADPASTMAPKKSSAQPPKPASTSTPKKGTEQELKPAKPSAPTAQAKAAEARARYEAMAGVTKVNRSQMLEERAKRLGELYGLDIKASDWHAVSTDPDETILRMDKPIRMRVRRTCHRCEATFTAAKECPSCQHVRCTKCPRHPAKRTEAELIASREKRAAIIKANKENAPLVPDYEWKGKDIPLTRPSKTGGQDLVYKKPRQRVRRTCHECQTLFVKGNKNCAQCDHARCTDCPRDPPKKDKYPFGYPGDEFGPSSVPHFECEKCKTVYPKDAEHGTECKSCSHPKSDASPRAKPRKVEPEPDPEILKRIHEKLASLKVS